MCWFNLLGKRSLQLTNNLLERALFWLIHWLSDVCLKCLEAFIIETFNFCYDLFLFRSLSYFSHPSIEINGDIENSTDISNWSD